MATAADRKAKRVEHKTSNVRAYFRSEVRGSKRGVLHRSGWEQGHGCRPRRLADHPRLIAHGNCDEWLAHTVVTRPSRLGRRPPTSFVKKDIKRLVLPPCSPRLNGAVERANRTSREEFYECSDAVPIVEGFGPALRHNEDVITSFGPHQTLSYCSPAQLLQDGSAQDHEGIDRLCRPVHQLDKKRPPTYPMAGARGERKGP